MPYISIEEANKNWKYTPDKERQQEYLDKKAHSREVLKNINSSLKDLVCDVNYMEPRFSDMLLFGIVPNQATKTKELIYNKEDDFLWQ